MHVRNMGRLHALGLEVYDRIWSGLYYARLWAFEASLWPCIVVSVRIISWYLFAENEPGTWMLVLEMRNEDKRGRASMYEHQLDPNGSHHHQLEGKICGCVSIPKSRETVYMSARVRVCACTCVLGRTRRETRRTRFDADACVCEC